MSDQEQLILLQKIVASLDSDRYENGGIYTIGGAPGVYQLRSPYNTECEYMVLGAVLAATSGNGLVVISNNNNALSNLSLGQSFGGSGFSDNTAFEGIVLPTGASSNSIIAVEHWQPLGRGANIYVFVSTTASYAYIALRRRLDRAIPNTPRPTPHTHSLPAPRRHQRILAATGPMGQGFDDRYQRGMVPYVHQPPGPEDPANIGNVDRRYSRNGR